VDTLNIATLILLAAKATDKVGAKSSPPELISGVSVAPGDDGSLLITGTNGIVLVEYEVSRDFPNVANCRPEEPRIIRVTASAGFASLGVLAKSAPRCNNNPAEMRAVWSASTVRFECAGASADLPLLNGTYPDCRKYLVSPTFQGFGPIAAFDYRNLALAGELLSLGEKTAAGVHADHSGRKGHGVILTRQYPHPTVSARVLCMGLRRDEPC